MTSKNQLKKVLYVIHFPTVTGGSISLSLLVKNLDKKKYQSRVVLVHPQTGNIVNYFNSLNIVVDHIPLPLIWDSWWFYMENLKGRSWNAFKPNLKFINYLKKIKPDIIHINDFPAIAAGLSANKLGIPIVWHTRSVILSKRMLIDPGNLVINTIKQISKKIIAISEDEARQFSDQKVKIIYNPIEVEKANQSVGKGIFWRTENNFKKNDIIFFAPIALTKQKGAWDLINAFGIVKQKLPNYPIKLIIMGDQGSSKINPVRRLVGQKTNLLYAKKLINKNLLDQSILLLKFKPEIYDIYDSANIIIFPTHLLACGRPCVEAGVMGKPVIVALPNKKSNIILHDKTGLIVKHKNPQLLAEAMIKLVKNTKLAKKLGQTGKKYITPKVCPNNYVKEIKKIYETI